MSKIRGVVPLLIAALLMGIAPSVAAPAVTLEISPKWITAEHFSTEGISVEVTGLAEGEYAYPRFEDGEAPAIQAGPDGVAAGPVVAHYEMEPGVHRIWVTDADNVMLAETEIHVTVLAVRAEGTTIVGTGFEPGQPVGLAIGDTEQEATAADDGRVVFDSRWSGSHEVTLSSAAGEISATLQLAAAETSPPTPPLPGLPSLLDSFLDAVQDREASRIAEQMDEVLERQRQLLDQREPTAATLEGVLGRVRAESEQRIQLNAEAMQQKLREAKEKYEREQERLDDMREERQRQLEALQQQRLDALDRMADFIRKMKESRASIIANMRSTPIALGTAPVAADGTVTVRLPAGVTGDHHIALIDPDSGLIVGWVPVSIEPAGPTLPRVGAAVAPELLALAAALALGGAVTRSRVSLRSRSAGRR